MREISLAFDLTFLTLGLSLGGVLKKIQNFNFFERAQKRSKLSENDIDVYLRLFLKYGAKLPSQKKIMRVQSRSDGISAGESGTCIVCTHK